MHCTRQVGHKTAGDDSRYFLQPTDFPLVELGKQRGNTSLDVWVDAPTYVLEGRDTLSYLDVTATHTFGADEVVRPATRSVRAQARDGGFSYTFPAHSLTILRVELAGG